MSTVPSLPIPALLVSIFPLAFPLEARADDSARAFAEEAGSRIEEKLSVRGDDPEWFFLVRELRHLAAGAFWEKPWAEVARNETDPVPSIVEFHEMLSERDIELVLAPIPAKGTIYPEKLDADFEPGDPVSTAPFLDRLRKEGLTVIDLESALVQRREGPDDSLWYCRQDAHFAPATIELLAGLVREAVPEIETGDADAFSIGETEFLSIAGDLVAGTDWEGVAGSEILELRRVRSVEDAPVTPDPTSPFLLLGDSHTLVFHQGAETGMHCTGAGLFEHLSREFGSAFDLVGVRGSGLVQARKQLFFHAVRHPGYWDEKRLVVWAFSMREWTQSRDRILPIPLER